MSVALLDALGTTVATVGVNRISVSSIKPPKKAGPFHSVFGTDQAFRGGDERTRRFQVRQMAITRHAVGALLLIVDGFDCGGMPDTSRGAQATVGAGIRIDLPTVAMRRLNELGVFAPPSQDTSRHSGECRRSEDTNSAEKELPPGGNRLHGFGRETFQETGATNPPPLMLLGSSVEDNPVSAC